MRTRARIPTRPAAAVALAAILLTLAPAAASAGGYDVRTTLVNAAVGQLGKPYAWASAGPNAFDCSGLVQYAYASAGVSLPHQSGLIWSQCETVTADKLEPGDLVFRTNLPNTATEPRGPDDIRHVGIYVGGGQVVHAPGTGQTVCYTPVSGFRFFGRLRERYWPLSDRSYDQPSLLRGDFTGDGREDIACFYGMGGLWTRIYLLRSKGTTFEPLSVWYENRTGWDWKRSKPVAGDFNRDGKADIAVLYDQGGGTSRLWMLLSTGSGFRPAGSWTSGTGAFAWARAKPVAGDFDGDGRADVGILYDYGGNTTRFFVARSTGSSFAGPLSWYYSGAGHWDARATKVAAGDLTGDGRADVAMLYDYGRGSSRLWVLKSGGSALTIQSPAWYVSTPNGWDWNRVKMTAADVTGDKKSDLLMLYDYPGRTSKLWSFISGGTRFSAVRTFWSSSAGGWDWERTKLGAGDFDRDGRADAVMLYDYGTNTTKAWTFRSAGTGASAGCTMGWYSGYRGMDWNRVR